MFVCMIITWTRIVQFIIQNIYIYIYTTVQFRFYNKHNTLCLVYVEYEYIIWNKQVMCSKQTYKYEEQDKVRWVMGFLLSCKARGKI